MARFAADSRLARLLVLGGVIVAGWLLGMIFGVFGTASMAHADTLSSSSVASGSALTDGFPTASDNLLAGGLLPAQAGGFSAAEATAQAMAGRNVDGLTSQSKPVLPAPSSVDHSAGSNGLTPQGGGSILFGEVARSAFDPRLLVLSAPTAAVAPPVVRTAADDPSFSPD